MAKRCDICNKKTVYGNQKVHKHSKGWRYRAPKTKRAWGPNLRKVKVTLEGNTLMIKACMSCYRRIQRDGNAYIKRKNEKLYKKLARQISE